MATPKDKPYMGPIEVITSVQRRRRWTPEEKRALLEEAEHPGYSISAVARRYGINSNQMLHWRKLMREGALVAVGSRRPSCSRLGDEATYRRRSLSWSAFWARRRWRRRSCGTRSALPVKKISVADALAQEGRFPVKAITDPLGVSRSNVYAKRESAPLRRYWNAEDDALLPLIRQIAWEPSPATQALWTPDSDARR